MGYPPLTEPQQLVLKLIAQGSTAIAAAASVGVHRNTIANWRRGCERFKANYSIALYEQALHWHDAMQALAPLAVHTLHNLLTDEKTSASVKLRAALAVL